ncbi:MAG: ABC transporter permease [[Ruminococcus] torques]
MVQDKANGTIRDLRISPVKSATLSLSYYTATLFSTLIICFAATGICLTYVAIVGWNMLLADIFFLFLDILLLVLFGTALSSIINFFLSTQGQISAVGTIISAGYGFICGAYMPISSFGKGLQKNNLIFARHLWYITYPKSYNARGACRNTKSRYSNSDY